MARKILCSRCHKIHEYGKCPVQKTRHKSPTQQSAFRSSYAWTKTSKRIRERDNYLCQACLHNLTGDGVAYTTDGLEVHHIESLEKDFEKRLDDDNLITLCKFHHELFEDAANQKQGGIDAKKMNEINQKLKDIARNNGKIIPPGSI